MVEVTIFPVRERLVSNEDCYARARPWRHKVICEIIDINVFRYRRDCAAVERRDMQSLLPALPAVHWITDTTSWDYP